MSCHQRTLPPWRRLIAALALSAATSSAQGVEREVVRFTIAHSPSKFAEAVFVLGDRPELGDGDITRAVRLQSPDRVHWETRIGIPLGSDFRYRFVVRENRNKKLSDPDNGYPITEVRAGHTSLGPIPSWSKRVRMHTALDSPVLHWLAGAGFVSAPLERLGPGRFDGEGRFGLDGIGEPGAPLEFYLTSGDGSVREPASGAYTTPLDAFFLQDGELYTYRPAPQVSPMRRDYPRSSPISFSSAILGKTRRYRVMLPRGYDEHTARRYPVLYLYDGQAVWDLVSGWDDDGRRMAALVRSGEVGEVIQVAIDFDGGPCGRGFDTIPPDDTFFDTFAGCGGRGEADRFLAFVTQELKPHIDASYRTKPGREHTFLTGFSGGGILSIYAGWDFARIFGAVAPQSFELAILTPNFHARLLMEGLRDARYYIDCGDKEQQISAFTLRFSDDIADLGLIHEVDYRYVTGFRHFHSHFDGGRRMREMMTFLYPATAEPNAIGPALRIQEPTRPIRRVAR